VLTAEGEHSLVAITVGAEPALAKDTFPLVDDLYGRGIPWRRVQHTGLMLDG
jgi:hypothetical protein